MAHDQLKGMVLAAGLGTRLRPLSYLRAKPAIPLLGRPLIQHALDQLVEAQIREAVVNLHHLPSTVLDAAARSDMRIHFSKEETILGTAGALAKVRDRLAGATVAVINGKIYSEEKLSRALEFHRERQALVTLVVLPYWEGCPFNPVLVDSDLRIRGFARSRRAMQSQAQSSATDGLRPFVFTGIHLIEPRVVDRIGEGYSDTVSDLYPPLISEGGPVLAFVSDQYWFETSTPQRYLEKSIELLRRSGGPAIPFGQHAGDSCVDTVLGRGCNIAPGAQLRECVLWDRVDLSEGVSARRTIFTEGVRISTVQAFDNCTITPCSEHLLTRSVGHDVRVTDEFICWPMAGAPAETSSGR